MMLSWEFPPRIIGGLAAHVHDLSKSLVQTGVEVHVVTCDFPGAPAYEDVEGIHVHRVDSYRYPTPDFATWAAMMNVNLQTKAAEIMASTKKIHLIHAHDWLVANASVGLKHVFRIPLIVTIHSTEQGRRGGLYDDYQRMINSTEAWLTREAWRIICCSKYMAVEVARNLGVPQDKIDVVPNGIDSSLFEGPIEVEGLRARFALADEILVLYVGRLVYEKGITLLVEAMPQVLRSLNVKLVIVGEGYLKEDLINRVHDLGLADKVYVTGFLDSETLRGLFRVADVCVIPSMYEPFGIVALEAMAAGSPIVTSGVGGLGEILEHDKNAVFVYPTPESIAWGITKVLKDPTYADRIRQQARMRISSYRWEAMAESTLDIYRRALREFEGGTWKPF
jgi:glycosyltransferase involved in cell wall biosynthesis